MFDLWNWYLETHPTKFRNFQSLSHLSLCSYNRRVSFFTTILVSLYGRFYFFEEYFLLIRCLSAAPYVTESQNHPSPPSIPSPPQLGSREQIFGQMPHESAEREVLFSPADAAPPYINYRLHGQPVRILLFNYHMITWINFGCIIEFIQVGIT